MHTKVLDQALDHGLIMDKVDKVLELNQKAWLKPYVDMNTERQNIFDK